MIMSFAAPLGVGTTSLGEYFDMELTETVPTKEIEERLNAVMVDGVSVCSARQVEDGKASTAMALVAGKRTCCILERETGRISFTERDHCDQENKAQ